MDTNSLKWFGDWIRKARHNRGVSQESFADLCGLHRTYVGGIERGERNPSLLNVFKLLEVLGWDRKAIEHMLCQAAGNSTFDQFPLQQIFSELSHDSRKVFWMCTPDHSRLLYVSQTYEKVWGLKRSDLYNDWRAFTEAVHPEDRLRVRKSFQSLASLTSVKEEYRLFHPDGSMRFIADHGFAVYDSSGQVVALCGCAEDITEAKLNWQQTAALSAAVKEKVDREMQARSIAQAALREREQLASLSAAIGMILCRSGPIAQILQECAEALVLHLEVPLCHIWLLEPEAGILHLHASAGPLSRSEAACSMAPLAPLKVSLIAQELRPVFSNSAQSDETVADIQWAREEGIVSFGGCPLLIDDRLAGVVNIFSRQELSGAHTDALSAVASCIALGIGRKRVEERLSQSTQLLELVLKNMEEESRQRLRQAVASQSGEQEDRCQRTKTLALNPDIV